jgi:hypothetical protein
MKFIDQEKITTNSILKTKEFMRITFFIQNTSEIVLIACINLNQTNR